jgi:hypothetical protein
MYRGHIEVIVKQETGWVMVFNVTFNNISVISWHETQLKCTNNFYLVKLQVLIYICAVYQTKCRHVFHDNPQHVMFPLYIVYRNGSHTWYAIVIEKSWPQYIVGNVKIMLFRLYVFDKLHKCGYNTRKSQPQLESEFHRFTNWWNP